MSKFINRTGEKHITNEGYEIEIIEYFGWENCTVLFLESNFKVYNVQYPQIKAKQIKNPYHPSILGIGYLGVGKYKAYDNIKPKIEYLTWKSIITRAYNKKVKDKYPTYKDCSVDERWYNFQNFAEWFEENYNPGIMQSWNLDKDILVKGNKIYSPETCCFVPQEINVLVINCKKRRGDYPIGVSKKVNRYISYIAINGNNKSCGTYTTPEEAFQAYKVAKEQHIKDIADKWKDKIDSRLYKAMYSYEIEITD